MRFAVVGHDAAQEFDCASDQVAFRFSHASNYAGRFETSEFSTGRYGTCVNDSRKIAVDALVAGLRGRQIGDGS